MSYRKWIIFDRGRGVQVLCKFILPFNHVRTWFYLPALVLFYNIQVLYAICLFSLCLQAVTITLIFCL